MQKTKIVDADRFEIPFAIDGNGKHLRAVDVITHRRDLMCPGCRKPVVWRRASKSGDLISRASHFAHRSRANCAGGGWESMAHAELKLATIAIIRSLGVNRVVTGPLNGNWTTDPEPEMPYPGTTYVADIGLSDETGQMFLGLEIIATSEITIEKRRSVLAVDGTMMASIDAKPFARQLEETRNDHLFNVGQQARNYIFSTGFNVVTMPLTRSVVPAAITVVGGNSINCRNSPDPATTVDATAHANNTDDIERAAALRVWHTNPHRFPGAFDRENWKAYFA